MGAPPRQLVPGGHVFRTDEYGEVDDWALNEGFHNGPYCEACHVYFCEHCERDVYTASCAGGGIVVISEGQPRRALE